MTITRPPSRGPAPAHNVGPRSACSEGGCDRPRYARGLCKRCYQRLRLLGKLEEQRLRPAVVAEYLDGRIRHWRKVRDDSAVTDQALWAVAVTSLNLFQEVRERLLGEPLAEVA